MKKIFTILSLTLIVSKPLIAQKGYGFLEVDKATTLELQAIKSNSDTLSILTVTDGSQGKGIKITPWLIRIKDNTLIDKKEIKLNKVSKKDEEKVRILTALKNGNILMISNPDKKEGEMVARLFSPAGVVLKEAKIAEDAVIKSLRFTTFNNGDEIRLSYYNSSLKAQYFLVFDNYLQQISEKNIVIDLKSEKDYLFENILYEGPHAYCIDYNFLDKASELGQQAQFNIYKFNLNEGKLEKKTALLEKTHATYPRYFIRKGLLEIFMLASPVYDKVDNSVITIVTMRLSDLSVIKKKDLCKLSGVASLGGLSTMELAMLSMATDSAQKASLLATFKSINAKSSRDKKTKTASAANFKVFYNETTGVYSILYRMATEESYNTTETNFSTNRPETVTYYSTSFGNTEYTVYNPTNDSFKLIGIFENSFGMGGNKFSKLYLTNQSGGDYGFTPTGNNKFLVSYISGVESVDHTVHFRWVENNTILKSKAEFHPGTSGNTFFYLQSMQEVAPNVFICDVYTRGKGSRIMIVNFNLL